MRYISIDNSEQQSYWYIDTYRQRNYRVYVLRLADSRLVVVNPQTTQESQLVIYRPVSNRQYTLCLALLLLLLVAACYPVLGSTEGVLSIILRISLLAQQTKVVLRIAIIIGTSIVLSFNLLLLKVVLKVQVVLTFNFLVIEIILKILLVLAFDTSIIKIVFVDIIFIISRKCF